MKVNIIILNYNGLSLLQECLPSIVAASRRSLNKSAVTVLDNCSSDKSVDFVEKNFPEIRIIKAAENKVFCSYNAVAKGLSEDILILLNNDIKVEPDFIDPLIKVFKEHQDAFLAGPKCFDFNKRIYEGCRAKMGIKYGQFFSKTRFKGFEKKIDSYGLTMQSGFGAFKKDIFLKLGGFDDLYLPGIMEDADLCYRAYKCGYRGYYVPESHIYHKGQASFSKVYKKRKIMEMAYRNTFLFMWKNITDPFILFFHIVFIFPRMVVSLLQGRYEFCTAFFKALLRMPQAIEKKAEVKKYFKRTDKEVLKISESI